MFRVALSVVVLLAASASVLAADTKKTEATNQEKPVVVDPFDLRQPVPNPERELTEKYDSQLVQYTGQLKAVHTDKKRKTNWYELQTVIRQPKGQGKNAATTTEYVTVTVYLKQDDKRLQNTKSQIKLTVEGRGEITTDGGLVIRNAQIKNFEQSAK